MPLISQQTEVFEELAPFIHMTVSPNGVTVGDLAFVSAQTHWSTAISLPNSSSTANLVDANLSFDMFSAAIGDTGAGFTTALTRTETSWLDTQGRLAANQAFIATECAFQVFLRSDATTTGTATSYKTIKNVAAVQAIGQAFSWNVTIGDGITRTIGSLGSYGGLGALYSGVPLAGISSGTGTSQASFKNDTNLAGAQGAFLGDACCYGVKLRVPLVFPPNINVRIKVQNGNAFTVPAYTDGTTGAGAFNTLPASSYLAVKQYLRGYLCTMPV
jgi:hypothetical protein